MNSSIALRATPYVFVVIWASGYVVAKFGLPYADPLTFLCLRYVLVIVLMLALARIGRAAWPRSPAEAGHIAVAGMLIQAGYLGGVWCAIKLGMPAGLAALIVNTQPILTALASGALGERVRVRQWLGLALGFGGVALVVSNKLAGAQISPRELGLVVFALLSITTGMLYQKHFCPTFDARTGQVIQFLASLVVTLPIALMFEPMHVQLSPQFCLALAWSVLVLSGVGISLLFFLIRRGAATVVASYMYLVPPVTALMAWAMFRERLDGAALLGMLMTVLAVAMVVRKGAPAKTAPAMPE